MADSRTVIVIDDDRSIRDALQGLFETSSYDVKAFESAEEFLAHAPENQSGCLVLDVRLPGMSGLELQRLLMRRGAPLSIVIMTGHGDIPMAVTAVKEGATEFVEKPFNPRTLLEYVQRALSRADQLKQDHDELVELRTRYMSLSPREQQVMQLLMDGCATKVIARQLDISPRTAETHRARVMEKMGADSLSVLVKQGLFLDRRAQES
jgi:FixJ family two-component response regulator